MSEHEDKQAVDHQARDGEWLQEGQPQGAAVRQGPSWLTWAMLAILCLLALVVIFVLPRLVERYELPFTARQQDTEQPQVITPDSSGATPGNAVSPFEEAQQARQRREAQDVLETLLNRQEELDALAVRDWAADTYDQAMEAARRGDEHYRNGAYQQARQAYTEGNELLGGLLDSVPEEFERQMNQAEQAMQAADAQQAERHYQIALELRPDSEAASTGLERARSLDEVEALVSEAEQLREDGELEDARARLEEAVELDDQHQRAQELLTAVRDDIREAEFSRVMSRGFALLEDGQPEAAIESFREAQNIRPDSDQAEDAISQAREQITNQAIANHRARATEHEENEAWSKAVDEYEAALELDPNLVFAQEGRDYAEQRARLDRLLQNAIDNPVRLGDEEVLQQTRQVYETGRGIADPGSRLQRQLDRVEELLAQARQPVEVEFVSDNATRVTIYQVGELGQFDRRTVELMPGSYVAVGTRSGYRDVRREFVVGFGNRPGPITLQCQEQIAAADGS